ncbi:MAG TPA: PilT/PilU family type 4a pilus ATPase [Kiritimatiellia bacterium]|nr:PilT/PilU family type 4a pilus ATPase [Kiritimatiellia bacterium]
MANKIDELLRLMVAHEASDLHLTTSLKPYLRIHGSMQRVEDHPELTQKDTEAYLLPLVPEDNMKVFAEKWDTDFAYELEGVGRFRVNIFMDHNGLGGVMRIIPSVIPNADKLGLPQSVRNFCYLSKGLVVVTGPTGSGKSTTLAAMIDMINNDRREHIITIEDPIEFVHPTKRCLINQREVHKHTRSFSNALRAALREDPDVVLVGEMRDLETIEIAIETAETGHLVFGTLHTTTAASTVDRIIDKFPPDRQNQIRTMLADSLKGVVAQTLCKRRQGGRVAVMEVLVINTAVASNIREGKTHHIPSAMQTGKSEGMQVFNDELIRLIRDGVITPKEAYLKAIDKIEVLKKITEAGFTLDLQGTDSEGVQHEALLQEAHARLQENPSDVEALNTMAWVMSTCVDSHIRDGAQALKIAKQAFKLSKGRDVRVMQTLAAACAENGNFKEAIGVAQSAAKQAAKEGQSELAGEIQKNITLYEAGRPLREA